MQGLNNVLDMRKLFILSTLLITCLVMSSHLSAQNMSKEEQKYWKKKAKMYAKEPQELKSEFENLHNQIEDLKKRNKSLELSEGSGGGAPSDSLVWEMAKLEGEYQNLKKEYDKLQEAYKTQKTVSEKGIKEGLVYRVQIGAFVLDENADYVNLEEEKFSVERSDGMFKYILGAFRSLEEAERLKEKLEKMGVDKPWIVPYIDGVRVDMDEARQYANNLGNDTFYLDE